MQTAYSVPQFMALCKVILRRKVSYVNGRICVHLPMAHGVRALNEQKNVVLVTFVPASPK